MTVKELINKLQKMPQNMLATVYNKGGEAEFMDIVQVSVKKVYVNSTDTIEVVVVGRDYEW